MALYMQKSKYSQERGFVPPKQTFPKDCEYDVNDRWSLRWCGWGPAKWEGGTLAKMHNCGEGQRHMWRI